MSSVLDCNTIVILPRMRKAMAVKSYFQKKVSLRKQIAKIALMIMAVAELAVSIVISANGSTPRIQSQ